MLDMANADISIYCDIYWHEMEPETKSIQTKISDISEIIAEAYHYEPQKDKPYDGMSRKERWEYAQKNSNTYKIHLENYFKGEKLLARHLKHDLTDLIENNNDYSTLQDELFFYSNRMKNSFAIFGVSALAAVSLPLLINQGSLSGLVSLLPEGIIGYSLMFFPLAATALFGYSLYNTFKSIKKKKELEQEKAGKILMIGIIDSMPDEYFIGALDMTKEKLSSSLPEIKKA